MCAYGRRAVAGFEKANVSGSPTKTVREDGCLKRTQATHFFLPMGKKKKKSDNGFSLLNHLFFSVLFSPT